MLQSTFKEDVGVAIRCSLLDVAPHLKQLVLETPSADSFCISYCRLRILYLYAIRGTVIMMQYMTVYLRFHSCSLDRLL